MQTTAHAPHKWHHSTNLLNICPWRVSSLRASMSGTRLMPLAVTSDVARWAFATIRVLGPVREGDWPLPYRSVCCIPWVRSVLQVAHASVIMPSEHAQWFEDCSKQSRNRHLEKAK